MKTKFPLTVYLLRCQWGDQTSREGCQWVDMITSLIVRGDSDCVRPAIDGMQRQLWLFPDDPAWLPREGRHVWGKVA